VPDLEHLKVGSTTYDIKDPTKVSNVGYDTTNKAITKTLNGVTTQVVTASDIIGAEVGTAVTDWLDEHCADSETVGIDDTLTIHHAAADAKSTGDRISELVEVSDTTPESTWNKVWVKETVNDDVVVPTNTELQGVEALIAPPFDQNANYAAGSYVTRTVSGVEKLYRFTSAHTGIWTGTDAVETKVGNDISDVKSAISGNVLDLENIVGVYVGATQQNGYRNTTGGYSGTSSYHSKTTDFIPCSEGDVFKFVGLSSGASPSAIYYDSSKAIIDTENSTKVTIPSGVSYVKFSSYNTISDPVTLLVYAENWCEFPLAVHVQDMTRMLYVLDKDDGIPLNLVNGYIDARDGIFKSDTSGSYKATKDYIPVIPGASYTLEDGKQGMPAGYAFYDENKEFIPGSGVSGFIVFAYSFICPANARYIRLTSFDESGAHTVKLKFTDDSKILNEVALHRGYDYAPVLTGGYIKYTNGEWVNDSTGEYKCTWFIPIIDGVKYEIKARPNGIAGYAFYNENHVFIENSGGLNFNGVIPSGAKYIRFTDFDPNKLHTSYNVHLSAVLNEDVVEYDNIVDNGWIFTVPTLIDGYIDYRTGGRSSNSFGGQYKCTEYIELPDGINLIINAHGGGVAGYAFYDVNKQFIPDSGGITNREPIIPSGAKFVRFTDYNPIALHGDVYYIFCTKAQKEIVEDKIINIQCVGDSVTAGIFTTGSFTSFYGDGPYPAQLNKLLFDAGYKYANVTNCGHPGERTVDIAVRCGGFPCYFSEDITIPGDGSAVSLGVVSNVGGRAVGSIIKIPYADSTGNDYCVYFTRGGDNATSGAIVQTVYINDVKYLLDIDDSHNQNKLRKKTADGVDVTITAGTLLFTSDNRDADVNIFYGGLNDGQSMSLQRFLDTMTRCGAINGGKYIMVGSTHPIWNNWDGITGDTAAEKYQMYLREMNLAFGVHFIDMYKEWFEHAMEYSLEAGYWTDKTQAELEEMEALLAQKIIPSEFTGDGTEGDVHLSIEGYYVFAKLIFERLKMLNYLSD